MTANATCPLVTGPLAAYALLVVCRRANRWLVAGAVLIPLLQLVTVAILALLAPTR